MTSPFDTETLLALNVRRMRRKRGFTQAELGARARVSSQYISKIERSISTPTTKVIGRIANALEVDTAVLFEEPDSEALKYYYTDLETRQQ